MVLNLEKGIHEGWFGSVNKTLTANNRHLSFEYSNFLFRLFLLWRCDLNRQCWKTFFLRAARHDMGGGGPYKILSSFCVSSLLSLLLRIHTLPNSWILILYSATKSQIAKSHSFLTNYPLTQPKITLEHTFFLFFLSFSWIPGVWKMLVPIYKLSGLVENSDWETVTSFDTLITINDLYN